VNEVGGQCFRGFGRASGARWEGLGWSKRGSECLNAMSDRAYIGPVRYTHGINRDKLVAQTQVMEAMMKPGLVN
jgi:hypothetical protein